MLRTKQETFSAEAQSSDHESRLSVFVFQVRRRDKLMKRVSKANLHRRMKRAAAEEEEVIQSRPDRTTGDSSQTTLTNMLSGLVSGQLLPSVQSDRLCVALLELVWCDSAHPPGSRKRSDCF